MKSSWSDVQNYFKTKTQDFTWNVSQIHLRKLKDTKALFKMNYTGWRQTGDLDEKMLPGNRFQVKTDISNCFPSIYTHSIPWAVLGKENAKNNRSGWSNDLDTLCQHTTYGETHGLIVGPHATVLAAEIVLTAVDEILVKEGWQYVRYIDDYICYVKSYKDGQKFLSDLQNALHSYDLAVNWKKTEIMELPVESDRDWVERLQFNGLILHSKSTESNITYRQIRAFFSMAVELMKKNGNNAAILNYAIKQISNRDLTEQADNFLYYYALHLAYIYPYLVGLLDKYIFRKLYVSSDKINTFVNKFYESADFYNNEEGLCYSLYFALKYAFRITAIPEDFSEDLFTKFKNTRGCIFLILLWIYSQKFDLKSWQQHLFDFAANLSDSDWDRNWILGYEILPQGKLKDEWAAMKKNNVSFLRADFMKMVEESTTRPKVLHFRGLSNTLEI